MPDECLTPEEVALRLKVLPKTVRKWLRDGLIPGIKVGRQWRIAASTVDGLISGDIVFGDHWADHPDRSDQDTEFARSPGRRR